MPISSDSCTSLLLATLATLAAAADEDAVELKAKWRTDDYYVVDFSLEEKMAGRIDTDEGKGDVTMENTFAERYREEVVVARKGEPDQLERTYSRYESRFLAKVGDAMPTEREERHRGLLGRGVRLRTKGSTLRVSAAEPEEVHHALGLVGTLSGHGCRWEDLLPGEAKKSGDRWTVKDQAVERLFPGRTTTEATATCQLEGVEKGVARIKVEVRAIVGKTKRDYRGVMLFSVEKGRALSIELKGTIVKQVRELELRGEGSISGTLAFR